MNPDHRNQNTASEKALKDWKRKIPLNRAGRRDQLSRYKYYLELNESDTFWSVYAVRKDGNKVMVDNSANYKTKYNTDEDELEIVENNTDTPIEITEEVEEKSTQEIID